MKHSAFKIIGFAVVGAICFSNNSATRADSTLIKAKHVVTMAGDTFSPGVVLVTDGKIAAVGTSADTGDARVVEVDTIMPGLINPYSQAGISGQETERTREVTPRLESFDIIDWQSRDFTELVASGVTTVSVSPGTDNVISGISCTVKTAGAEKDRMLVDRTGLVIAMCSDPASRNSSRQRPDSIYIRQPTNRMGVVWILRSTFHRALNSATPNENDKLIQQALQGQQPVISVSRTAYDVTTLLRIGKEFGFKPILVGGEECWKIRRTLAEAQTPVILGRIIPGRERGSERTRVSSNNAGILHEAGVPFCFSGSDLLDQARFAVRYGLDRDAALAALTTTPAKILKVENRVGKIAVGHDADLLGLNGDPLEFTSSVNLVMVNGRVELDVKK